MKTLNEKGLRELAELLEEKREEYRNKDLRSDYAIGTIRGMHWAIEWIMEDRDLPDEIKERFSEADLS